MLISAANKILPRSAYLRAKRRYYGYLDSISLEMLDKYDRAGIQLGTHEFKRFINTGLIDSIDDSVIDLVSEYHERVIGRRIDPILSVACSNLYGVVDARYLPRSFYWNNLIPVLNDMDYVKLYSEKNIYSRIFNGVSQPGTVLKRINGRYFNSLDKPIEVKSLPDYLASCGGEYIIKPSRTDNGEGIQSLVVGSNDLVLSGKSVSFSDLLDAYGDNFLIQETIKQHDILAEPHPSSVNTLRILTLRWQGKIHFLQAFARFGSGGAVNDNAGTGGVCVGVDNDGKLQGQAISEQSLRFDVHPSTGYAFIDRKNVPGFQDAVSLCTDLHGEILHHDFVSWDIAIDKFSKPVFIEFNFRGALWLYQLVTTKPILGEFTEEVCRFVCRKNNGPMSDYV